MSSSSYAPNEAESTIMDEVAWLQGAFISSLLCGVQITLSVMSFIAVLKQRLRRRLRITLLTYILLLCAIMTAGQEVSLLFIQMGFIEDRNYPGGPNAFLSNQYMTPMSLASTGLFVFGNWMMESLMVWRCQVVCSTGERPIWFAVIVPLILLIAEYVTGILFLYRMLRGADTTGYTIAYSSLSILLNVTVTIVIAGRLSLYRRRTVREFGRGHGSCYASVAAILIESASLYTGFLILVIVFFSVGTATSNVLQQAVAQVESITSLLIIYRIARGKGWSEDTIVSSVDWRASAEAQIVVEVVHLEMESDPTLAPASVTNKEDVMQTARNSVGSAIGGNDVV